jgi:hypothetical protein
MSDHHVSSWFSYHENKHFILVNGNGVLKLMLLVLGISFPSCSPYSCMHGFLYYLRIININYADSPKLISMFELWEYPGINTVFFVEGGNSRTRHSIQTRGSGGTLHQKNFENLWPLRLFLVASETTYTNKKFLCIILSHSIIICITIILSNFQGGGSQGSPSSILIPQYPYDSYPPETAM